MKHIFRWSTLVLLWWAIVGGFPAYAETPAARPRAAMIVIAADDSRRLVLDLGDAAASYERLATTAPVEVVARASSPLPVVVQQLMIPTTSKNLLLFKGEATATPALTQTPYVPRVSAQFVVAPDAQIQTDMRTPGARFVELTCALCPAQWELAYLNQLPDYAPIVVYAPGIPDVTGAWLIHVKSVAGSDLPTLGTMVSLYERTPAQPITAVQWRAGTTPNATYPPERLVQVDGRSTLLRITLCLVAVLLCSIASFYLSLALMRRMHAAVGYKPEP